MKTEVSVKTTTEVEIKSGVFLISSFSDMNEDGSITPVVFKSRVLDKSMKIDNQNGKEGELLLSFKNTEEVGEINNSGELILDIENDRLNRYHINDEDLMYNQILFEMGYYNNDYQSESYSTSIYFKTKNDETIITNDNKILNIQS